MKCNKMLQLIFIISSILLLKSYNVFSQAGTLDPTFNIGDNINGARRIVYRHTIQSDGKIIIIGDFVPPFKDTVYNQGDGIARLNTDGTLDYSFNPGYGANSTISSISIQDDGKIIIGGAFTSYNGITRNKIARINSDGSLDNSFNPGSGANSSISSIAIQNDGKIIIGGNFTSYNGIARKSIARLNDDGSLDTSFNPGFGANSTISSISIQNDGKIIIGGDFNSYNGILRNKIARINNDGSLDASFNPGSSANSYVSSIATQDDGKIIIGGEFTSYNGIARKNLARINNDGSLDVSFNPGSSTNSYIYSIAMQGDGKIIIGGAFTSYNDITRNKIARINSDGSLDNSFNPGSGANSSISSIAIQSDGKIIIGGYIASFNGKTINGIARLHDDGSLDNSYSPVSGSNSDINSIAIQSDDKIIIGGNFTIYNNITINGIARLNSDGNIDASFNSGSGANFYISKVVIQVNGKIIIGGNFNNYNGIARNNIARLNSDGSLDIGFNPGSGANSSIYLIAIQNDGKIIIGGNFSSYNGILRNRIARLNSDGSLDLSFNTGTLVKENLTGIAVQSDGKIIFSQYITDRNGFTTNQITRSYLDGTLDPTYNFNSVSYNSPILSIAIQNDNKIVTSAYTRLNIDGSKDVGFNTDFKSYSLYPKTANSIAIQNDGKIIFSFRDILCELQSFSQNYHLNLNCQHIIRLNIDGSLDSSFEHGLYSQANSVVYPIAIQNDGKIIIGGSFTKYNGKVRTRIARLFGGDPSFVVPKTILSPLPCVSSPGLFQLKLPDILYNANKNMPSNCYLPACGDNLWVQDIDPKKKSNRNPKENLPFAEDCFSKLKLASNFEFRQRGFITGREGNPCSTISGCAGTRDDKSTIVTHSDDACWYKDDRYAWDALFADRTKSPLGLCVYAIEDGIVETEGTSAIKLTHNITGSSDNWYSWYDNIKPSKGIQNGTKVVKNQHIGVLKQLSYINKKGKEIKITPHLHFDVLYYDKVREKLVSVNREILPNTVDRFGKKYEASNINGKCQGSLVSGANVSLKREGNWVSGITTDEVGHFEFITIPAISVGDSMKVEAPGYEPISFDIQSFNLKNNLNFNIPLFKKEIYNGITMPSFYPILDSSFYSSSIIPIKVTGKNYLTYDVVKVISGEETDELLPISTNHPYLDTLISITRLDTGMNIIGIQYYGLDTILLTKKFYYYPIINDVFQVKIINDDEYINSELYIDGQFNRIIKSNSHCIQFTNEGHNLTFSKYGYADSTIYIDGPITLNLQLNKLPITNYSERDSSIYDFINYGKIQYKNNVTLCDVSLSNVVSLKQYYCDFTELALLSKSRKFEYCNLNANTHSFIKSAMALDQVEYLCPDSIYLLRILNNTKFSKIPFDRKNSIIEFDSSEQKLTNNHIDFDNGLATKESLIIMKKQAPKVIPLVTQIFYNTDSLIIPISNLFTDPDSLKNDFLVNIPFGKSQTNPIEMKRIGDNIVIKTYSCFTCDTIIELEAIHDWLKVTNKLHLKIENKLPQISLSGPSLVCPGDSVKLTSTKAKSYLWSNGLKSQSIYAKTSGSYSLSVINDFQCRLNSLPVQIKVMDTIPPKMLCPPDKLFTSNPGVCYAGPSNTLAIGTPTSVLDNCSIKYPLEKNLPANFPIGITNLVWTVSDIALNKFSCTQKITVLPYSCGIPTKLSVVEITKNSAKIKWISGSCNELYELRIRQELAQGFYGSWSNWVNSIGPSLQYTYSNLQAKTGYQFQVRSKCGTIYSLESNGSFKTLTSFSPNDIQTRNSENENVAESSLRPKIKLIPNPTDDVTTVYIEGFNEMAKTISLYDPYGKLVFSQLLSKDIKAYELAVNNFMFQNGIYFIHVFDQNNHGIVKLVVQK